MIRRVLLGLGASAVLSIAGLGCASQNAEPTGSGNVFNSTEGSGQAGALVNQGRFPAPIYSAYAEPNYALVGDERPAWASGPQSGYYQVGNGRIFVPPTR